MTNTDNDDLEGLFIHAVIMMEEAGLLEDSWEFHWDRATSRAGLTRFRLHHITVSAPLARINDFDWFEQVMIHEISHALAGHQAGHGPAWRAIYVGRGGKSKDRTTDTVNQTPKRYQLICPECGPRPATSGFNRRPKYGYRCVPCDKKMTIVDTRTDTVVR